jgi:hypothetical protein
VQNARGFLLVRALAGLRFRLQEGGDFGLGYKIPGHLSQIQRLRGIHSISLEYTLQFLRWVESGTRTQERKRKRKKEELLKT